VTRGCERGHEPWRLPTKDAAALAAIERANVTRDALERAFARAATAQVLAEEYLARTAVGEPASLAPVIEGVLVENAGQAETYRAGKDGVLRFLIGQMMGRTGGGADPRVVSQLLRDRWLVSSV
jgi:aspartyl-tRNA(Asn)/glutamyl-tRNA(Gln) amidotransferase subunit B